MLTRVFNLLDVKYVPSLNNTHLVSIQRFVWFSKTVFIQHEVKLFEESPQTQTNGVFLFAL